MSKTHHGITSILNNHYNQYQDSFEVDIISKNLKTAVLKIGEIPSELENPNKIQSSDEIWEAYFRELPKVKKSKLSKFYDTSKGTGLLDQLKEEGQKLNQLSEYLENYGDLRRKILETIYEEVLSDKKEGFNCNSIIFRDLVSKNPEFQKLYSELVKQENERLKKAQTATTPINQHQITNYIHNWLRNYIEHCELINSDENYKKLRHLLPNLAEDIGNSLFGFFRRLISAELQFRDKFNSNLRNALVEFKTDYKPLIKKPANQFKITISKSKGIFDQNYESLNQNIARLEELLKKYDAEGKKTNKPEVEIADIFEYNSVIIELRILINYFAQQDKMSQLIGIFRPKDYKAKVFKKNIGFVEKNFNPYKKGVFYEVLDSVFFDPKTTYPRYERINSIDELEQYLKNFCQEIEDQKRLGEHKVDINYLQKNKIFKEPFDTDTSSEYIKDKNGKKTTNFKKPEEIENKYADLNPRANAHYQVFCGSQEIKSLMKDRNLEQVEKINNEFFYWLEENFEKYTSMKRWDVKENKNYKSLESLADWYWVKYRLEIEKIADFTVRNAFIKKCSEMRTLIADFGYNLERGGFETQAMYLSDFYNPPSSPDKKFKSNTYLYTNATKNRLRLALSFNQPIESSDNQDKQALVYTYQQARDPEKELEKLWKDGGNDTELKYFHYDFWNEPSEANPELRSIKSIGKSESDKGKPAYSYFNKIELCPIGESEFDFGLQFGINQSRKYFWNKARKDQTGNINVHDIFDPESRLKISSMRLSKRFNPIRQTWEFYLNLAIYRLEKAKVTEQAIIKKHQDQGTGLNTYGFDVGENNFVAFGTVDREGREIDTDKSYLEEKKLAHITSNKQFINKTIEKAKEQNEANNFIQPDIRKKMNNKLKSVSKQLASSITKLALSGEYVVFEDNIGKKGKIKIGNRGNSPIEFITNSIQRTLPPKVTQKLTHECDFNKDHLIKDKIIIKPDSLFGFVPTTNSSNICSNCCVVHPADNKIINSTQIKFEKLIQDLFQRKSNQSVVDLEKFYKVQSLYEISKSDKKWFRYNLDKAPDKSQIYKADPISELTPRQILEKIKIKFPE